MTRLLSPLFAAGIAMIRFTGWVLNGRPSSFAADNAVALSLLLTIVMVIIGVHAALSTGG